MPSIILGISIYRISFHFLSRISLCLLFVDIKNPPANAGNTSGFDPWVGKIPWRKKWEPTAVFFFFYHEIF